MTVKELHDALGAILASRPSADLSPISITNGLPIAHGLRANISEVRDMGWGEVVLVVPAVKAAYE